MTLDQAEKAMDERSKVKVKETDIRGVIVGIHSDNSEACGFTIDIETWNGLVTTVTMDRVRK